MKLIRFGPPGQESPGLMDPEGRPRDLSGHVDDIAGDTLSPEGLDRLRRLDWTRLAQVPGDVRLGPPVGRVGKVMGIGLNYADHARETGGEVPPEPVLFLKATSAICGPHDTVRLPRGSTATDWEVELGVVIGTPAKYVAEADALAHVAGYCVVNDVSERDYQIKRAGQWTKGKSCDTFCPLGPWLVTRDEVPDPQALRLWLEVDGRRMQDGSTATMVYGVAVLVSYLSRIMTLHPGDVIATGTPPGVGMGRRPRVYLTDGNVMRLGVEGLGIQEQRVAADPADP
ncbi:fumarylacetoacetate hydrolase family protein [Roseospira visakhapatnamensis]|uniref:2-keto-4-pentenoate hydratase/2-oxohepta-3-ene-1,7-dioic acid hydratase in catechol pathway n=1 Tax=Roseospira visakhapatnamensis TaxID=390880 RepID=A0A7W6R9I9_9PROT|nr:fumarylacetoacetate hydrolase family protein [Roseospira visakhapatnamensis]MBB4264430.1 2-keto-4-pentenoate hydratase/2-oxohepta-3-ene-1,7-dioic acid hydratase in catechol pathway [Roseospira visakhapatnamensis]